MTPKHALITGATSGIGRALGPLLVGRGYAVTLAVRNTAAGQAIADGAARAAGCRSGRSTSPT